MKRNLINVFGTLGYLSLLIQWLWMILTLGMPIVQSDFFKGLFLPNQSAEPTESTALTVPEPIAFLFMVLAVIFAVGVTVYAIVAVPRTIARTGKKVTHMTTQVVIPRVTHHKRISKKREKRLYERITWTMKFCAALLPVLALSIPPASILLNLSREVVTGVGLFCASITLLWFGGQFVLVKLFQADLRDVW